MRSIVIILFFPLLGVAQEDPIDNIRKWYRDTESNLTQFTLVEMDDWMDEQYPEGFVPQYDIYFDEGEVVKVDEYGVYDWFEVWNSYYFKNGKLYFVFSRGYSGGEFYSAEELEISEEELWERGFEAKTLEHFQYRYYYFENALIRCLEKHETADTQVSDVDFSEVKNIPCDMGGDETEYHLKHTAAIIEEVNSRK